MTDTHADADLDMDLSAAGDDWRPTPHGRFLARVLSQHDFARGKDVLELGAGVANHTILLLRQEPRSHVATEILPELLDSTRANVERNCGTDQPIEYRVADWLSTEGEFDLVVTNPPFCKSGKQNRRYFIDSLILDTHKRLRPGGELVFIQSSMADVQKTLARLDENGFDARVVDTSEGPFRDYYFQDEAFMAESKRVPDGFKIKDGVHIETLSVIHAKLRPFTPHEGAHIPADRGDS